MHSELCASYIFQKEKQAMCSSARFTTTLQQGAEAKVTLKATAPGISGKHSEATVQVSGPSKSKVVVSASGASNKKRTREGGPSAGSDKGAGSSTLFLCGPNHWARNVCVHVLNYKFICVLNYVFVVAIVYWTMPLCLNYAPLYQLLQLQLCVLNSMFECMCSTRCIELHVSVELGFYQFFTALTTST